MYLNEGALGVVTDIHANPFALAQVLADGRGRGVDRWLVLGDVVAMGPRPDQVLDQLAEVDVIAFAAGNTDRNVLMGDYLDSVFDEVAADLSLLPRLADAVGSFAWTKGFLQASGSLAVLGSFQPRVRLVLPDGTHVLAVHASLIADDGRGIAPDVGADEMAALFPEPGATLVFGGHTHEAADLSFGRIRYVNPGSVSNHHDPHRGACYSIVRLGHQDHTVEHRELGYDKQLAIDSIRESGIPGAEHLLRRYFNTTHVSK